MRDHTKLRAFQLAEELTLEIYRITRSFPKNELFGLTSQMRRAAVPIASNIVEGCARHTAGDYIHSLDIAHGSARELEFQFSLAQKLGYVKNADYTRLLPLCVEVSKVLNGLLRSLRHPVSSSNL